MPHLPNRTVPHLTALDRTTTAKPFHAEPNPGQTELTVSDLTSTALPDRTISYPTETNRAEPQRNCQTGTNHSTGNPNKPQQNHNCRTTPDPIRTYEIEPCHTETARTQPHRICPTSPNNTVPYRTIRHACNHDQRSTVVRRFSTSRNTIASS